LNRKQADFGEIVMSDPIQFSEVRKRTIQLTNYEDGLWDLLLGIMFMLLAIYPVTRQALGPTWNLILFLVALAILVGIQLSARRLISDPRLGYVKPRLTRAKIIVLAISAVLVLVTFVLVIITLINPGWLPNVSLGGVPQWLSDLSVDILVMLALAGIFSLMGYLFGVFRLFIYGWLIGIGNLASTAMHLYRGSVFNLPLAIAAGIIILVGVVLFTRFLRKYPLREAEV
jgi:hypothetical protein